MRRKWPGLLVLTAGAALLITGIAAGQPGFVLAKGIRICLECIGIG